MKKKSNWKQWLHQWDIGELELLNEEMDASEVTQTPEVRNSHAAWIHEPEEMAEQKERRLFAKLYPVIACVLSMVYICLLLTTVGQLPTIGDADTPTNNEVIARYVEHGMEETGAVNIVAGIILDYRAFDTLGESHVLYTAVVAVLILLLVTSPTEAKELELDEPETFSLRADLIVRMTAKIMVPIVLLFGVYVVLNGHLSPGGGFSGGSIIGAGFILYAMAFGDDRMEKLINMKRFRIIVLCALCFYSVAKCYSFFCGANGLHSIISTGVPGRIFSAGLILPLNIAVGIVVSCTMYGFYSIFRRGKI